MKLFNSFIIGLACGMIVIGMTIKQEHHFCQEEAYRKAFLDCNTDRLKVKQILRGDSLGTLVYW